MTKQEPGGKISERLSLSGGKYAIVVAGADCVWDDVDFARELLGSLGLLYSVIVINDMIADYPRSYDFAATLHPDKLGQWLSRRDAHGLDRPNIVFAHRRANMYVTNSTNDWGGSSALFATKIMIHDCGVQRVIVCGAPMTPTNHYHRGTKWNAAIGFRRAWQTRKSALIDRVRSCSGWTRELLGTPDADWLTNLPDGPPSP